MKHNLLSARTIGALPVGKHLDGRGLWLIVSGRGVGKWVQRVNIGGKRREMGLGGYPDVSLAKARDAATTARRQVREGIDPIAGRTVEAEQVPTFSEAAARYIEAHAPGWNNLKHAAQWTATLATYAAPIIGPKPVDAITTDDVLKVLSEIWISKTETAKRVQGRIENILDWSTIKKYRVGANPDRWRGYLDQLLPNPNKVSRPVHHPAMAYTDVPAFMCELEGMTSVSSLALRFLILTATRTSETLQATWSEVDLEARCWTIPDSRMKAGQAHRVPLSDGAMAILQALPRVEGNPYLFPGARRGKPLSNMALLQLMRGMGYGVGGDRGAYVPHGFRSAFRDWSGEVSNFPRDVCEMALAHTVESKVEAAYRRGDLFTKRAMMMQAWSEWCGRGTGADVIAFPGRAAA
ncbi:MAG TPA: integrase arm-type DNA-binding domain-containing protein [Lamprocystis sp. (in: g-proteobacteria)]|nr:integrase arm-type DNA-binding domain-containing protein [Lamprocystis sp. (in: g-proteobacteria)]